MLLTVRAIRGKTASHQKRIDRYFFPVMSDAPIHIVEGFHVGFVTRGKSGSDAESIRRFRNQDESRGRKARLHDAAAGLGSSGFASPAAAG
jgi:hypothetical protein